MKSCVIWAALAGLAVLNVSGAGENMITVSEQQLDGEKAFVMENALYRATFVPERAMWPLWYYYKPTGHEVFLKKEASAAYKGDDGLVLCLPWVGDTLGRVANKGLLKTAPWETAVQRGNDGASIAGRKQIEYPDPATGKTNRLAFKVSVTGSVKHSQLKMDYEIENIGRETARFMFIGHARLALGGSYDQGDYVYAPGPKCWVGNFKWPALEKQGIKPYQWTAWPIKGAIDFVPRPQAECKGEYLYAFVPSAWAVVGDDKSKEFAFFYSSPITIGKETRSTPYYCILRRDGDYLLELSVTPELDAKNWAEPWATASLNPGEKAGFTVYLAVGQGLGREDAPRIQNAAPQSIQLTDKSGKLRTISLTP